MTEPSQIAVELNDLELEESLNHVVWRQPPVFEEEGPRERQLTALRDENRGWPRFPSAGMFRELFLASAGVVLVDVRWMGGTRYGLLFIPWHRVELLIGDAL